MDEATDAELLIAIADDHPIVREALRSALGTLGSRVSFVEAFDAAGALELVARHPEISLLLIDLQMPGADGLSTVRAIRELAPQIPVAVVSAQEDPAVVAELLRLGACGFIPKSDSGKVIVNAVRLILAGGVYVPPRLINGADAPALAGKAADSPAGLTARQIEVLRLLGKGLPNKLIARQLGISEGTVKVHLLAVYRVLKVRNRTAAVLAARDYRE